MGVGGGTLCFKNHFLGGQLTHIKNYPILLATTRGWVPSPALPARPPPRPRIYPISPSQVGLGNMINHGKRLCLFLSLRTASLIVELWTWF